jgi:hypothetical protein
VQVFFRAIDTSGVGMSIPNLTISTDTPGASIVDTADLDALVNALTGVKVKLPPQPGLLRLAVEAGEERAVFPFIVR